jgi:AcrR family transcriptional regulator
LSAGTVTERSQREEARAARREVILDAARRVFAARGFRGTTIADIAEEAKIALGTIYLYFPSKEDVLGALSHRFWEMIVGAITDVPEARSLRETVGRRVDNVFETCQRNRDLVRLVVLNTDPESAVARRMRESEDGRAQPMVDALKLAMDQGTIRQGDPAIMAKLISGLVSIAVYQAFVLSDGSDAEAYSSACAEMALAYLTPTVSGTTA